MCEPKVYTVCDGSVDTPPLALSGSSSIEFPFMGPARRRWRGTLRLKTKCVEPMSCDVAVLATGPRRERPHGVLAASIVDQSAQKWTDACHPCIEKQSISRSLSN